MAEIRVTSDDGTVITAIDEGSGPTVLIVHPGGADERSWDVVASLLSDEFRVLRIRRRIYAGAAAADSPGHTFALETADVLAVAALAKEPILLVGHSSGAVAALEAALFDPSPFAAVVAYEPPMPTRSLVGGPAAARARAALEAGDTVEAMRIHLQHIVRMPVSMVDAIIKDSEDLTWLSEFAAGQITDDEAIDRLGLGITRYRMLDLPTVLIQGDGDHSPKHILERTADLAAVIPDVRVVTLDGQGHVAHLMAPQLLAAQIRDAAERFLV